MPGITHRIVKTPNPSVWSLAVTVQADILGTKPDFTPMEGTAYKNFPKWLISSDFLKNWGDYTYVQSEDGNTPGSVTLLFVKNFTPEENSTPFRTITYFDDHRWPAIMLAIGFPPVQGVNHSHNGIINGKSAIILSKMYSERRVIIPEVNEGTLFKKEEFFSNVPFTIPQYDTPVETEVFWDIPNGPHGSFVGLHPDIPIPHTQVATAGIVEGNQSEASSIQKGQFFPATNFEDWSTYVWKHTQEFQNGYYAVRIWVTPPTQPEAQVI